MATRNAIVTDGTLLAPKRIIAAMICSKWVGRLIGSLSGYRLHHRGAWIRVPAETDPRIMAALFWGMYESAEIRFVHSHLVKDRTVVELGSSLGGVACEIARILPPGQKLVCVEANPHLVPWLEANLRANAPGKDISVSHAAIDYDGLELKSFVVGSNSLDSHLGETGQTVQVPCTTLSRLIEQHEISDYSLVCDIEGAEVAIFCEDARALGGCRQLIIELHDTSHRGKTYGRSEMIALIERTTKLGLTARYGDVCVFSSHEGAEAETQ